MDKETVFSMQAEHQKLRSAQARLKQLKNHDPGYPEGREHVVPLERYYVMRVLISPLLIEGKRTTPEVYLTTQHHGVERQLAISLGSSPNNEDLNGCLYAHWRDLKEGGDFDYNEKLERSLLNPFDPSFDEEIATTFVNQFETSYTLYMQIKEELSSEQAQQMGFPTHIVDGLRVQEALKNSPQV